MRWAAGPPPSPSPADGGGKPAGPRLVSTLLVVWFVIWVISSSATADAQDIDELALRVERALLCPQCTNLRLDVCDTQLCADMRADIRARLARGESEQEIVESFVLLYGHEVLADVPASGFNLLLFGWAGASLLLVASVGTLVLMRLRRSAAPPSASLRANDDQWIDEQLASERDPR
jgi:cytochrome c-type biogenesis protein CcmH